MTRVAILWTHWSGYMEACYQALRRRTDEEPFVCFEAAAATAPFDPEGFMPKQRLMIYQTQPDKTALLGALEEFAPDLILICSWHIGAYREVARKFRGRAVRVLGMDHQWLGSLRQVIGLIVFHTAWLGLYDVAFVPGARQVVFARLLGFRANAIRLGLYAADVSKFQEAGDRSARKDFAFVGRDAPEKGLDTLLEAYLDYRNSVCEPRSLVLIGPTRSGYLGEGVLCRGFVQPDNLPQHLKEALVLVVPSTFEPHGVVVHEAAASGVVLICSDAVGAADMFLRRGINGVIFPRGSREALRQALVDLHGWTGDRLGRASEVGKTLSAQFTPETWAAELIEMARSEFARV